MRRKSLVVLIAALLLSWSAQAQAQAQAVNWGSLRYLMGDWVGVGAGGMGQASGGTSFAFELQERLLVRRNRAVYPATRDRPAYTHDDLMIIYHDAGQGAFRAVFFDNEGHVINYAVQITPDGDSFVLVSDALPGTPRYRLTYHKTGPDTLDLKFEIAPPGKPEAFAPYINAKMRRAARGSNPSPAESPNLRTNEAAFR